MKTHMEAVAETADFLRSHVSRTPRIGLITGTGLSEIADSLQQETKLEYASIPNFPVPTVESHTGRLLFGSVGGQSVMVMQGRFHLYEGYSAREVTFPIRVMQRLGVGVLVLSNAAGGLNSIYRAGDIMIIADHLNLTGENPLIGPNEDRWGPRFPEMSRAYAPALAEKARQAAKAEGFRYLQGVYAGLKGPSLETPAEVRFLKTIGADAVGFSTVLETIAAVHGGMKVLGLSIITNLHDPENPAPVSMDQILNTARRTAPEVGKLIARVIPTLSAIFPL